jgi:uncharacterized damage-inducible protein DinB
MDIPIGSQERSLILDQLASSESRLLSLVEGLTQHQWTFRESPERWSIHENLEHLVLFERFILGRILDALKRPAEPEMKKDAPPKEPVVLNLAASRSIRFNAREAVLPTGRWRDPRDTIAEFQAARVQTTTFARSTKEPLRDHFFPHIAFGELDCCQWLLVLGQHSERHALQIEQVQASPAYPQR